MMLPENNDSRLQSQEMASGLECETTCNASETAVMPVAPINARGLNSDQAPGDDERMSKCCIVLFSQSHLMSQISSDTRTFSFTIIALS